MEKAADHLSNGVGMMRDELLARRRALDRALMLAECGDRLAFRNSGRYGPSSRIIYICKKLWNSGFMIKDWKCTRCKGGGKHGKGG